MPTLGQVLDRRQEAQGLARRFDQTLERIRALTGSRPRPRVLLVFKLDPLMVSGPGTVNDELLEIAGGVNAAADANAPAPVYDREGLLALRPEVILLLLPDAPPLGAQDPRLATLRGLAVPAVTQNRIVLLSDSQILLPGSHLPDIAGQFARAIHPDLVDGVEQILLEPVP